MSRRLKVVHRTAYAYSAPVTLGEHRLMVRPRDSHDLRLVSATLTTAPEVTTTWAYDAFGNSIAKLDFGGATTDRVEITSEVVVEQFALDDIDVPLSPWAQELPFTYTPEEAPDLAPVMRRHYPDPDNRILSWAREVTGEADTIGALKSLNHAIRQFDYSARYEEGTQEPLVTLDTRAGTCRDYALLMMEAARALGLAARFCTGYLYDPAADGAGDGTQGAGATHAWAQVYLPGAGWLEFDPTNDIVGGDRLIRVAVTRDPAQAIPLTGSFSGPDGVTSSLDVDVRVNAV
ncbi:MAG: transglutaminase family protein [Pseudomonadota bacterium]